MATNKEITMKQYNGVDYDTLYPKTTSDQIVDTIPLSTKTSGTLSVDRGGTGATTASSAMNNLISALSTATPDDSDLIPFKDVSGNTVGNMTVSKLAELASASGVKIQTGSYVGTGTYGRSNPCSLTFDKIPDRILITNAETAAICVLTPNGGTGAISAFINNSVAVNRLYGSTSGATVRWYATYERSTDEINARHQANGTLTYYYMAIFG